MKRKPLPLFTVLAVVLLSSCQKDMSETARPAETLALKTRRSNPEAQFNTFYGPEVQMGHGKVRSFSTISHASVPKEIGIEITGDALTGLPTSGDELSFHLALHQKASRLTPFDHLELDWNPQGHPPPGVYTVPHFDAHFYMITEEEQMAIPGYSDSSAALFDNPPPPGYLPANYIPIPGGIAQMGKHWADITSPELQPVNPAPFTKTFIYGTYNGKVTFLEPMVTLAYLKSGVTGTASIPQPQYVSPTGRYYPTRYSIYKDASANRYYISLSDFVLR